MSQPFRVYKLLQTTAILFVAALYCLAPLQQPLASGFHKLEHAILNSSSNHSHELSHHLHSSHAHEHKMLSFFNNLFSDDAHGNEHIEKECKLDKHVLQPHVFENSTIQINSEKLFNYRIGSYTVLLPFIVPPPEADFS